MLRHLVASRCVRVIARHSSTAFCVASGSDIPHVSDDVTFLQSVRDNLTPDTSGLRAFYSSRLGSNADNGAVVTDPAYFSIALDDRGFHRGHAVFDTCNVVASHAYGLSFHLDRLLLSAQKARIDHNYSKAELKNIILRTLSVANKSDNVFVRFWLTAGRGTFGIAPTKGETSFYCVVHDYDTHKDAASAQGVAEAAVTNSLTPCLMQHAFALHHRCSYTKLRSP